MRAPPTRIRVFFSKKGDFFLRFSLPSTRKRRFRATKKQVSESVPRVEFLKTLANRFRVGEGKQAF